jgi:hypothetical protein
LCAHGVKHVFGVAVALQPGAASIAVGGRSRIFFAWGRGIIIGQALAV